MTDKKQTSVQKTQFRDQLSHHDPTFKDNKCIYDKHNKTYKEDAKHVLCSCLSRRYLYEDLKIGEFIRTQIKAKNVIIWDDGKSTNSPINLLNAIWTITVIKS